ncbi:MAG: MBL fold metallo-hydrolase [Sedimentisphaerales bacterium]|nr:MBL fold metallo-hydrolase [Sedimentisphaerales bacterium]
MKYNVKTIRQDIVKEKGRVIVYWLGGYGFMLKFSTGQIFCIDPYLSDCVERIAGFPRLSLAPLTAEEVTTDAYLITHNHPDHLDVDSFDTIVAKNPGCAIVAGKSCEPFLKTRSTPYNLATVGEAIPCGNIKITAVSADHGDFCPEAIGFIIQFENRTMYFTGDTSLNENLLAPAISYKPDILIPCINPKFGNLGETGAAQLAKKCSAKIAIPSHFGLFAEHGGDVGLFREQVKTISPTTQVVLLTPGRGVAI